ncbi:putative isoflavone reductase family protein [Mycena albidolilacea]|uniref:Isoflavone reductase family protein n=1 Tax=Mycena albidolilacea TaxID=1033008 RepID=A0AAD6Z6Z9_9AGAR|nr:putative isoflavone reductase family protein [Mycena albidolilacea]
MATSTRQNYIEKVAIVGAGGQMGTFITEALLKTGKHHLTAITRADSTSKIPAGVEVKKVDYEDPASLVEALRGQDALIITMSVMSPPGQSNKLIEAAAVANVPWVLPNEYGFDPTEKKMGEDTMLGPGKQADRDLIEKLGKSSWVGITCSFWYEYSLSAGPFTYGFDFENRSVTFIDDGTTKINTTTWPQTALAVARLLSLKVLPEDASEKDATLSQFRNKPAYVSSFLLSQKDMLESVLRVTGTKESDWKIEHEAHEVRFAAGVAQFKGGDRRGFGKLLYTRAFYPDGCGNYEARNGLHNDILGLPKEDLDEFTRIAVDRAARKVLVL